MEPLPPLFQRILKHPISFIPFVAHLGPHVSISFYVLDATAVVTGTADDAKREKTFLPVPGFVFVDDGPYTQHNSESVLSSSDLICLIT